MWENGQMFPGPPPPNYLFCSHAIHPRESSLTQRILFDQDPTLNPSSVPIPQMPLSGKRARSVRDPPPPPFSPLQPPNLIIPCHSPTTVILDLAQGGQSKQSLPGPPGPPPRQSLPPPPSQRPPGPPGPPPRLPPGPPQQHPPAQPLLRPTPTPGAHPSQQMPPGPPPFRPQEQR